MRLFKLSLILLTLCAAQNVLAYSLECHGANGLEYKRSHNDGGANMTPYEYLKVNGVEYIVSTNPNGPIYKAATFSLDKIVKGKVSAK